MKKIITAIALCLLITLTACSSKPSGKYVDQIGYSSLTFTGNEVVFDLAGEVGRGTFTVKDDTLTIQWNDAGSSNFTYDKKADTLTYEGGALIYTKAN